eukprot:CAMPEP_0175855658 /NCGR_PEP_ID=MMETSP0107_2-20121207/28046_1 /TAXON_ID=195067 ORGANISM="Goniomonas pacifica, Strain CCMP1869" /NCGR_SAMPLE_ID=MMETSP0107_2 /ASSEMBLY_ACC=CAM_ASM_000203 /LENGTH=69 /DNA_ID=CAMNT_0017171639 /DNA_START=50 /DNA_END=259 /DNA_ORIENTATION=-
MTFATMQELYALSAGYWSKANTTKYDYNIKSDYVTTAWANEVTPGMGPYDGFCKGADINANCSLHEMMR